MGDYSPLNAAGSHPFPAVVGASAVTGGRVVMPGTTGTVIHATTAGGATAVGVAAQDGAPGATVSVWPLHGPVHQVSCPGGVAVGAGLVPNDTGIVATATIATAAAAGTLCGVALSTVGASGSALATFAGRG